MNPLGEQVSGEAKASRIEIASRPSQLNGKPNPLPVLELLGWFLQGDPDPTGGSKRPVLSEEHNLIQDEPNPVFFRFIPDQPFRRGAYGSLHCHRFLQEIFRKIGQMSLGGGMRMDPVPDGS
jgi:hypothetical protein